MLKRTLANPFIRSALLVGGLLVAGLTRCEIGAGHDGIKAGYVQYYAGTVTKPSAQSKSKSSPDYTIPAID